MPTFPDIDTNLGGYTAEIACDTMEMRRLKLWGVHPSFDAARARAQRVAKALRDAGEAGARGHVGWTGERPRDFPKLGVGV